VLAGELKKQLTDLAGHLQQVESQRAQTVGEASAARVAEGERARAEKRVREWERENARLLEQARAISPTGPAAPSPPQGAATPKNRLAPRQEADERLQAATTPRYPNTIRGRLAVPRVGSETFNEH
jgi:hypothetical protein